MVVLFLVRAFPQSRGGRAGFTIIAIIALPQKFILNRHYHNLFNTCRSISTTLKPLLLQHKHSKGILYNTHKHSTYHTYCRCTQYIKLHFEDCWLVDTVYTLWVLVFRDRFNILCTVHTNWRVLGRIVQLLNWLFT